LWEFTSAVNSSLGEVRDLQCAQVEILDAGATPERRKSADCLTLAWELRVDTDLIEAVRLATEDHAARALRGGQGFI